MPGWALKTGGGGGSGDWFLDRLATARVLVPDAGFDTILGDDWGTGIISEQIVDAGTADATLSENDTAGVVVSSVGDAVEADNRARLQLTGSGSHVKQLNQGAWYVAALVKITQPLDVPQLGETEADAITLWNDENNRVGLGILGNASGGSTTRWVGYVDNGAGFTTVLGPNLDGEESPVWHLFEAWFDGTDVHYSIDSQEFSTTISGAALPAVPARLAQYTIRADGDVALTNTDKYCVIVKSPTVGES